MPNFPSYRGELPECLSPLKLRHYSLLAYWVYFRPTALHCYLYQASPDVYQVRGYRKFLRTLRVPAYRNIYLMLPIAIALLLVLVGLVVVLYTQATIQSNGAWVNAIAVTPDGQIAISATGDRALKVKVPSADSSLKVWNLKRRSQMHILNGHEEGVTAVATTPDSKWAVSASRDRTLKIWDLRRGTQLHNLKGHKDWLTSVVITPDGKRAISASADSTLKVWNLYSGKELKSLSGHTNIVNAVAITPDGRKVVSASDDKTIKTWDLNFGKELKTIKVRTHSVNAVAITPSGQQIVSASSDRTLKVWDLDSGKELKILSGHTSIVNAVAITPDGRKAVSASDDKTLRVWDLTSGEEIACFTEDGALTCCAVAPDGVTIVAGEESGRVHFLRLEGM